jgi:hypothetical protein
MNRVGAPNHHSPTRSDTQKPPFPGSEKQNGEGHGRSEQFAVGNGRCWCRRVPLAGQLAATQWRAVRFIPGASHSPVDSPAGNSWTASRVGTDGRDRSLVVARTASKGVPAPTRPGGAWCCGGKAHRWVGPARADLRRAYTWRVRSGAAERWRWWGPLMVQGLFAPCRTWRGATLSLFAVVGTSEGQVLVSCEYFFSFSEVTVSILFSELTRY